MFSVLFQNARQRVFGDPDKSAKDKSEAGKGQKKGAYMIHMHINSKNAKRIWLTHSKIVIICTVKTPQLLAAVLHHAGILALIPLTYLQTCMASLMLFCLIF